MQKKVSRECFMSDEVGTLCNCLKFFFFSFPLLEVTENRMRSSREPRGAWLACLSSPEKHHLWNFVWSLKYFIIFAVHFFYSVSSPSWIMCKIRHFIFVWLGDDDDDDDPPQKRVINNHKASKNFLKEMKHAEMDKRSMFDSDQTSQQISSHSDYG